MHPGGFQIDIGIKNSRGGGSDIDNEVIQIVGGSHLVKNQRKQRGDGNLKVASLDLKRNPH